uniref:Uncharacterized protein n=1 Tax=Quercus lobata TaxID=97700 RepID=A0A7N2MSP9_QUELO
MRLVELYKPYVFFTGSFDDSNTEKLQVAARGSDADVHLFDFDPKCEADDPNEGVGEADDLNERVGEADDPDEVVGEADDPDVA